jgi:uncharacterized membrane-anchored protein YhcB (DUF1043 family)
MATYLLFGTACLVLGMAVGALVAMIYCAAAISRSQERMQRKVREAWDEARYYRERLGSRWPRREQRGRWETWLLAGPERPRRGATR